MDNNTTAGSQGLLFCHKCGAQLLPDSMFCDKCGTKVEAPFDRVPTVTQTTNATNTTSPTKRENKDPDDKRFITTFVVVTLLIVVFLLISAINHYNRDNGKTAGDSENYYMDTSDVTSTEEEKADYLLAYDGKFYTYYEEFDKYLRQDETDENMYYDETGKRYTISYNSFTGNRKLKRIQ